MNKRKEQRIKRAKQRAENFLAEGRDDPQKQLEHLDKKGHKAAKERAKLMKKLEIHRHGKGKNDE